MKKTLLLVALASILLAGCSTTTLNPLTTKNNGHGAITTDDKNDGAWGYLQESELEESGSGDDWSDAGDIVDPDATSEGMNRIYFGYDSDLLSEDARETLIQNAQWMMNNPGKKVSIEGHCDERGADEYNLALGERRAISVLNYIKKLGISEDRMRTLSLGEEVPLSKGKTSEDFAKNRRVEFRSN